MCWQELVLKPMITGLFGAMGVYLIKAANDSIIKKRDMNRVHDWLKQNVNKNWYTATFIASHVDLTPDRVRYICSIHNNIRANRKDQNEKDLWGLKESVD